MSNGAKDLARRWCEDIFNRRNLAVCDEMVADRYIEHAVAPFGQTEPGEVQSPKIQCQKLLKMTMNPSAIRGLLAVSENGYFWNDRTTPYNNLCYTGQRCTRSMTPGGADASSLLSFRAWPATSERRVVRVLKRDACVTSCYSRQSWANSRPGSLCDGHGGQKANLRAPSIVSPQCCSC